MVPRNSKILVSISADKEMLGLRIRGLKPLKHSNLAIDSPCMPLYEALVCLFIDLNPIRLSTKQ